MQTVLTQQAPNCGLQHGCSESWPLAGIWELGLQETLFHSQNPWDGSLGTEHLLPFWKSGIFVYARQRASTWPVPSKHSGLQVSNELPCCQQFNAGGIKLILGEFFQKDHQTWGWSGNSYTYNIETSEHEHCVCLSIYVFFVFLL